VGDGRVRRAVTVGVDGGCRRFGCGVLGVEVAQGVEHVVAIGVGCGVGDIRFAVVRAGQQLAGDLVEMHE